MPTGTKAGSAAPWLNWFGRGARAGLAKTASPKCSVRWCPTRCVAWFQYLTLVLLWLPHGPRGPNRDTAAYDRCKSPGHAPVLGCGLQVYTWVWGCGAYRFPGWVAVLHRSQPLFSTGAGCSGSAGGWAGVAQPPRTAPNSPQMVRFPTAPTGAASQSGPEGPKGKLNTQTAKQRERKP